MQFFLFKEKHLFGFHHIGVGDTAVDRAHSGALGFFMEAGTFSAFVWYDVVIIVGDRFVFI
jgi:hypothetical protein